MTGVLGTVPSAGADPCHLLVAGETLWVANYGDGTAAAIPLDADGNFAGPARAHPGTGSGPDAERQSGPHAHSATAVGDEVWVADLGSDTLRRFAGGVERDAVALPAGSGPRHLAVLPDGAVAVATELDDGLVVVRDGAVVARVPATATPPPAGARNYPSHVAVVGELLVVAVRGADVLSVFALGADGPVHLADSPGRRGVAPPLRGRRRARARGVRAVRRGDGAAAGPGVGQGGAGGSGWRSPRRPACCRPDPS